MEEKKSETKKFLIYLAHVGLTAIVSALIAILQNYIAMHTSQMPDLINPAHTATVGGILGLGTPQIKTIRKTLFT